MARNGNTPTTGIYASRNHLEQRVVDFHECGYSHTRIGKMTGTSARTVKRILAEQAERRRAVESARAEQEETHAYKRNALIAVAAFLIAVWIALIAAAIACGSAQ